VIIKCESIDMIECVITDELLKLDGVVESETMFAFRSYDKREGAKPSMSTERKRPAKPREPAPPSVTDRGALGGKPTFSGCMPVDRIACAVLFVSGIPDGDDADQHPARLLCGPRRQGHSRRPL